MDKKLGIGRLISISLMLFAMFFGAGNMIFPPMLGYSGGDNYFLSTVGFIITDAGLSVLGIAAVVLLGSRLDDLAKLISDKFAVFMGVIVYMLIGPLFALPRTGSVSYNLALIPFLKDGGNMWTSIIFTGIFFVLTFVLSLNESKIVDIVGKILTPILLISIAVIFGASVFEPVGEIGSPKGNYDTMPLFQGMIDGYLALDGLAALAFAIVVINSIKSMGVTNSKTIAKYTVFCGMFSAVGLGLVYLALAFVGSQTGNEKFGNGAEILASVVARQLGTAGNVVLGIAVLMACLTTAIGLSTSFSEYFHKLMPKYSYKSILIVVVLFSFVISNVGLTQLISITLPVLIAIYPPAIALVLLSFVRNITNGKREPYALSVLFAFLAGIIYALDQSGIKDGLVKLAIDYLPFHSLGLGWVVPAILAFAIGMLPFINFIPRLETKN